MKIILKKNYQGLGKKGEVKEVSAGFARNFLIPQGVALAATPSHIAEVQNMVAMAQKAEKVSAGQLKAKQAEIADLTLKIKMRADTAGKLFGSVDKKEIQNAIKAQIGFLVPKQKIELVRPIKKLGEYKIAIKIDPKIKTQIKLQVEAKTSVLK